MQAFVKTLPGVIATEAGRANGARDSLEGPSHLREAEAYIRARPDRDRIRVEMLPLTRYIPSAEEHQDRLDKFPNDYCHIPRALMTKYLPKE